MKVSQFSAPVSAPLLRIAVAAALFAAVAASAGAQEFEGPAESLQTNRGVVSRDGIKVEFAVSPVGKAGSVREGELANIEFRLSGAADGEPLAGAYPGVWIDLTQTAEGEKHGTGLACEARVGQYLQGMVGMRPMIDMNSYYVLALNNDASISVIDPLVGITGITSLYTSIPLQRPGADWAKTRDDKMLYVSMPRANKVAFVDLDTFKVVRNVDAGTEPARTVLQPNDKYLWVGNDLPADQDGGVTVIDPTSGAVVATIMTGRGHHEIAFSPDARTAFVSNRGSGTVSVIDTVELKKTADIATGPVPIALAYSSLSNALYVADGETGEIAVLAGGSTTPTTRIATKPGIGPLRFTGDGRFGLALNPSANTVYVIDAATNQLAHTVPISGKPFQLQIGETFAYIRSMESTSVSMLNLQRLARGEIVVNQFAAGERAPQDARALSIADPIAPAAQDAAVLVVSPGDATVYYYMEGMNAPMGAFRNYGHEPTAVQIANRALKQTKPGTYASTIKVPLAGTYEVAYLNETPRFLHCFTMEAQVNPDLPRSTKAVDIEYLNGQAVVYAGERLKLKLRLTDPKTGAPIGTDENVIVRYYRSPNFSMKTGTAVPRGDGVYEADLDLTFAGPYYVYVAVPSLKMAFNDLTYLTLMARRPAAVASAEETR